VIVEAGERSGALITADFALEQGREVLAVPGSILSRLSAGTNDLLKQGASPVTCVEDVLSAVQAVQALHSPGAQPSERVARRLPVLSPEEQLVWGALADEPQHVDELARGLGRRVGEVAATLAILELQGMARQVGAMLYTRAEG
jgi:DNA processing protein